MTDEEKKELEQKFEVEEANDENKYIKKAQEQLNNINRLLRSSKAGPDSRKYS